jgi:hypothetical protein
MAGLFQPSDPSLLTDQPGSHIMGNRPRVRPNHALLGKAGASFDLQAAAGRVVIAREADRVLQAGYPSKAR